MVHCTLLVRNKIWMLVKIGMLGEDLND